MDQILILSWPMRGLRDPGEKPMATGVLMEMQMPSEGSPAGHLPGLDQRQAGV